MSTAARRVVHCVRSDAFAGVERYIASVAPELARRGWDVHVIGGDPGRMRTELGAIRHTPAATTGAVAAQLLRCDRHTIVHAHMTAAEAAAATAQVLRRFPFVTTRHFAVARGSSPIARAGASLIGRAVDRQISISQFVAGAIGEPSLVILNGVPANDRVPTPELMVLTAQRLEAEKHTDVAIHAWARSNLRDHGWRLTLAGSGRQAADLAQLVDRLALRDSVEFVGVQTDMTTLMSRAAIFLATHPAEPFGVSVAEAMAARLPVIAASGGGHLETVGAANPGSLFPVGDARAAAALLDTLGADPAERDRIGLTLQTWQRAHLSIEAHVDQLERVYSELRR